MGKARVESAVVPDLNKERCAYYLPDGTKVYFIDFKKSYLPILWEWHKEHASINFPYQHPGYALFTHDVIHGTGTKKLAVVNGEVAGFIWFEVEFNEYEEKEEAMIRYVHVDPSYRGKGLGKILMQFAHNNVDFEAAYCVLGTHVNNESAIKLYEKMGYRPYRVIMRRDR